MTFERLSEHVYRYRDTCNVYVLKSGARALLIDLGGGSVLDHVHELGVSCVDWVVHTHHHRDQCQGDDRLAGETRLAVPAREAHLFEDVETFWRSLVVSDRYDCSNVFATRISSVRVDRQLEDYATLEWRGISLMALPTPGHTKGGLTFVGEIDGVRYAFCGDLIHSPGRVWTLHDLQWDYVNPDGLNVGMHSVRTLRTWQPQRLAPSHGDVIADAEHALAQLEMNMGALHRLLANRFQAGIATEVPPATENSFTRVSEHLIAATHSTANFYVLHADDGRALFFDYGFASLDHLIGAGSRFVEHSLGGLAEAFGVERPDVIIPTHYHDDHVAGIPFLQSRYGTEVWAYEKLVDVLAQPHAFRLPCLWMQPIRADRVFGDEGVTWEQYRFAAHHCPGHTWWAVMLFGDIDGRRVAITGDQIQIGGAGGLRGGGPIYRNRVRADSFTKTVRTLLEYEPELLLTGHDGPIEVTRRDLEDVYRWCRDLEQCWTALVAFPEEIGFSLDPDIASIRPYQGRGSPGQRIEFRVELHNHHDHRADAHVRLVIPSGWETIPAARTATLEAGETVELEFAVTPAVEADLGVRYPVTADVEVGEHRLGQAAEALIVLD
jgi:glyoxylase-like metal-dependent hydrolase (beta-lactamase superfamily II)